MKKDIHPQVNTDCVVTCACGYSFTTISILPSIKVEICSNCHPFFTGQQKFVDTEGRIDKFHKKAKDMEEKRKAHEEIRKAKKTKKVETKVEKQPSLKEMMKDLRKEVAQTETTEEPKEQAKEE